MKSVAASGLREKFRLLLEAGEEGLTSVQVDDILRAVCLHAQELFQGRGACVTVYVPEEDHLRIRACSGILEPFRGVSFGVEGSVSGKALIEGRPILRNELGSDALGARARELPVEIHKALSVPLPGWERTLGTLVVVRGRDDDDFDAPDERLLSAYAVPAALALRGAEQFRAERRRHEEEEARLARQEEYIRRLRALHDAELLVASETELDDLLQTVTDVARSVTDARYAAIGVLEREGEGLSRFVTSGLSEEERARYGSPPAGKGLLGAVIRERRSIRVSAMEREENRVELPASHHVPHSFLGVPISTGGTVFGNLYLTNKRGDRGFTAEDQVLVEMLAAQAAVAIEKAELFREREDLIERLETARRLRTRLSAYVNHDIRNALGGMTLWAERLEQRVRGSEGREEVGEMAQKIRRAADHALRLVKDVLDLTRLEEGRLEIWPREVKVSDLMGSAVDAVRPEAELKGIRLHLESDAPELRVVADPDRVHQIVVNLLSNAIKFSPEGTRVDIRCCLQPDGPTEREAAETAWVRIAVEDQGPGIHPDDVDRIFGVYEQARGEEARRKGLGIGLTLSRHLAELMGGRIEVGAAPGGGACFQLWLPVGREAERRPGWIG